jgi:hypothetical protein
VVVNANVVVAEMDPSRIDVACRAVTHELIPFFRAQPGAGSAYWMVDRTTGEVLVLTTWDDEGALAAVLATDGGHRASVAGRTGLVIRSVTSMEVLEAYDAGLTSTAAARWARATWSGVAASDRRGPGPCGAYRLNDAATGATLALSFWDRPPAEPDRGVTPPRVAELHGVGVAARTRER